MGKVIRVRYLGNQGAEDLFKNIETGRVYVRLPIDSITVRWTSASKWSGGYEADCHLKNDITVRVENRAEQALFEEEIKTDTWNGGTTARKVGKFSYEIVDEIKEKQAKVFGLQSYVEWKQWLMEDMESCGYTGFQDNWLFCEARAGETEVIDKAVFYDMTVKITKTELTHKVCGKKWYCIEIESSRDDGPYDICGYLFGDKFNAGRRGRKRTNPEKFSENIRK